jgi:Glycosyl transferase family 11
MVISFICGGLGNQMFQYAVARRLAKRHNTLLKLDLSAYRDGTDVNQSITAFPRPIRIYEFRIDTPAASEAEVAALKDKYSKATIAGRFVRNVLRKVNKDILWPPSHVKEIGYRFEERIVNLPADVYLDGFWQSWKYFDDIAATIRSDFQMKDAAIPGYAQEFIAKIRRPGRTMVSLHVRRGDRAHAVETGRLDLTHVMPLEVQYILASIGRFGVDADFLVFSDTPKDIAWCKENIKGPGLGATRLHFSEGHTDLQDMALMTACDHHIIAPSSFSWWAAWLNDRPGRRVIAPSTWSRAGFYKKLVPDDLIPPDWEIIQG